MDKKKRVETRDSKSIYTASVASICPSLEVNPNQKETRKRKKNVYVTPEKPRTLKNECKESQSTSHTQFFKKDFNDGKLYRITTDEYCGISESISGPSDSFHCFHKPEGKQYTEKGQLKRNLLKNVDTIIPDRKWNDECPPTFGWELAKTLDFLVSDPVGVQLNDRLINHIKDFSKVGRNGLNIAILDSVCKVLNYLVETVPKSPALRPSLEMLLQLLDKPILLNVNSDIVTHFQKLRDFIGFLGYILMRIEDDALFDLVSVGLMWQLCAPDSLRGPGTVRLRHTLVAAPPVLYHTVVRMIAVAKDHRFPTYIDVALLLACDSVDSCIEMIKEHILENIFYRFNPYFPEKQLPQYDINPADLQDCNVKLGASSTNMSTTLSLLLVLLKSAKLFLEKNPNFQTRDLPCPDEYAQRCFVWVYRYECRARNHHHQRSTLTVIAHILLHIYGDRINRFRTTLMPDVLSLSVLTELPPRKDWTRTVSFNTSQTDVQFKKLLMYLSVAFLRAFPHDKSMVEERHWLIGLMYLLDPALCRLRARWSPSLFTELRNTALQALMCSIPFISPDLPRKCGLIRRIMWYVEWYSESPYELATLYWCMRVLQVSLYPRKSPTRDAAMREVFNTHGIIIIMHLCHTLLEQKLPPIEKSQVILAINLRLLTSAVKMNTTLTCQVYPEHRWPASITSFVRRMLDVIVYGLDKHYIVSDRWLISLLNFIWEAIIWRTDYRQHFVANNGIYTLLDIIVMARYPVQCLAMSIICDSARAGDGVCQLITWRANISANTAHPGLVKQGATIASLLAAVFERDCQATSVNLDENDVIQELDCPVMNKVLNQFLGDTRFLEGKHLRSTYCLAAASIAGSRKSKAFALLQLLSEDLKYKVSIADEAYNLYKNIKLKPREEAMLVFCSHYLTIKLNEAWLEAEAQLPKLVPQDQTILEEFLQICRGWAKEVQRQQLEVIRRHAKKEHEEESSLYTFLGRVRLNIALDALREVKCAARSADRYRMTHVLLYDAVHAYHRRSVFMQKILAPVIRTYKPKLDEQNTTGQNVKVNSILPNKDLKPREFINPS